MLENFIIVIGTVFASLMGYYLGTVHNKQLGLKKAEELKRLIDESKDKEEAARRILFEGLGYKSKVLAEAEDEVVELKTATLKRKGEIAVLDKQFDQVPLSEKRSFSDAAADLHKKNVAVDARIKELWATVDTFHPRD